MHITIIAVGKLKERFWTQAVEEYLKRLRSYADVRVIEIADRSAERLGEQRARAEEAADILRALPTSARAIALTIEGTRRSSEQFAEHLDEMMTQGCSHVVFLIGGSTGLAPAILDRADETCSFGPLTLPHNLARVVLVEQIYRAFKILRGEPYHK